MQIFGFTNSVALERMKLLFRAWLYPKGRERFIQRIPKGGFLIDVGCGNNSPFKIKALRPDLTYIGVDVADYEQCNTSIQAADRYIVTLPHLFDKAIDEFCGTADAVISSHNIEHCGEPTKVLASMSRAVKHGGSLYLAFPCEASVLFPSRDGILNFFDHHQHKEIPKFDSIIHQLCEEGLEIEFSVRRYHPLVATLLGAILEPYSRLRNRTLPLSLTWALYGYQTVIWARRPLSA
jgi:SAM-dependent methyltransferase